MLLNELFCDNCKDILQDIRCHYALYLFKLNVTIQEDLKPNISF